MTTTTPALTERQREILRWLYEHHRRSGRPAKMREMLQAFGWASLNAPRQHLRVLQKKGYLTLDDNTACGVRLAGVEFVPAFVGAAGERLRAALEGEA